jgi:hypothetical protein
MKVHNVYYKNTQSNPTGMPSQAFMEQLMALMVALGLVLYSSIVPGQFFGTDRGEKKQVHYQYL